MVTTNMAIGRNFLKQYLQKSVVNVLAIVNVVASNFQNKVDLAIIAS